MTFTETDIATSESTEFLMDGEEFIFEFTFADQNPNLAYVEITFSEKQTRAVQIPSRKISVTML